MVTLVTMVVIEWLVVKWVTWLVGCGWWVVFFFFFFFSKVVVGGVGLLG